jgi:hypothetical protein
MQLLATLLALALQASASPAERTAIFQAAGFTPTGGRYLMCDGSTPLELELRDLNGDGRPEAIVTDGGLECYGNTGTGFVLLTRSKNGGWAKMYETPGIPNVLDSRVNGWAEIEVAGPGFCFPVLQSNGQEYAIARQAYEGRPCQR